MPGRRRYTKVTEAKVVALAEMKGQRAASDETGIPLSTIHQWFQKPEYAQLRTKTREDVQEEFWIGIQVGLKAVVEGFADAKLGEKAVALGVLYDKLALMSGSATSRSESRDITGSISDAELIAAVREADRIASGEGTPTPTEGEA